MKVDLNFDLLDLDGNVIQNSNVGKIVANSLIQQLKGDPLKFWEWALKLNKGESLDLDSSDFELFNNFIKDNEFPIITKAAILQSFKK